MSTTNSANANQVGQVPRTEFVRPDGRLTREGVAFLNLLSTQLLAPTGTASSATSGSATALPAQPTFYVTTVINGTSVKIPCYLP